jgi:hypothetical protein
MQLVFEGEGEHGVEYSWTVFFTTNITGNAMEVKG